MQNLDQWLADNQHGRIIASKPLSGGCVNQVSYITTETDAEFCLKQNPNRPKDFFICEAGNLSALKASKCFRVPEVIHVADNYLLLEFIPGGPRHSNYWQTLARQLADCHSLAQKDFGFHRDNYCGQTLQINATCKNGYEFFAERRLLVQMRWASDKGLLDNPLVRGIEKLALRLEQLIPSQPAALLHGDLWSGNLHSDESGQPVLIDPACYWGWPEADLAMTSLFGGFSKEFYQHYIEHQPLESGWRDRFPIYNLYHLLNHLNLFGKAYLADIKAVLNRFT
jgi:fructosamine-3-kinase